MSSKDEKSCYLHWLFVLYFKRGWVNLWFYDRYSNKLYHYGIKGMKWGVRRSKEELKYNRGSIESILKKKTLKIATSNGILIRGISEHVTVRANERKVTSAQIVDAVKNPLYVTKVKTDSKGRQSQDFIGRESTVSVNPNDGNLITVHPTGTRIRKKYEAKGV